MGKYLVTVGWTKSDRDGDYVSYMDGYREGADQHVESFEVEWTNPPVVADDEMLAALGVSLADAEAQLRLRVTEALAEAVFRATNDPFPATLVGLPSQVRDLIDEAGYRGVEAGHFSLSVGDTVQVDGVRVACDRVGWKRV